MIATPRKSFRSARRTPTLLYTFSFHMRDDFVGRVAGELALVLPHLALEQRRRQRFIRDFKTYVSNLKQAKRDSDASAQEKRLLHYFKNQQDAVATITILWANFGQKLENVTGMVTDVLPSRLSIISDAAQTVRQLRSPVFPTYPVEDAEPDLAFNSLGTLFKRPGGKKNKGMNESARLFEFKRDIAARVYHGRQISLERFWDEVLAVARAYLSDAAESGNSYGLLNEGVGKQGRYLTLAGWVKHLARYLYFFGQLEAYPMVSGKRYEPESEALKPFFGRRRKDSGAQQRRKGLRVFAGCFIR